MTHAPPPMIMVCYSHTDEPFCRALRTLLKPLEKQGLITSWYDGKIGPGEEWRPQLDTHMKSASIILLLLSRDFLASDYCYDVEMQHAQERHDQGTARVIPVVVRPTDLAIHWLSRLQMLPKGGKPVNKWGNRDEAYQQISTGIREAVEELNKQGGTIPTRARTVTGGSTVPAITSPQNDELEEVKRQRAHALLSKDEAASTPQSSQVIYGFGRSQPHDDATHGAEVTKKAPAPQDMPSAVAYRAAAGGGKR